MSDRDLKAVLVMWAFTVFMLVVIYDQHLERLDTIIELLSDTTEEP